MKIYLWHTSLLTCMSLLFTGCSARWQSEKPRPPIPMPVREYQEEYEQDYEEDVRFPEHVKAYPVGRYVDPHDPNILHEAHVFYRREQPSSWNHNLQKPTVVPLGPTYGVVDPETLKSPISETLEKAFIEQTELLRQLHQQNETLTQKLIQLETEVQTLKPKPGKFLHAQPH